MNRTTRARSSRVHPPPRRTPPGSSPGTLTADPNAPTPVLRAILYGPDSCEERVLEEPEDAASLLQKWPVVWVNVDGLGDTGVIARVAKVFGLHRLAVEDVINTHQRPKAEAYGSETFIVLRSVSVDGQLTTEQVSLFLGKGFVLTFQEWSEDCLDAVRERIRHARGRIRGAGADYLAYALLDAIIDNYFPVFERYGEWIEELEDKVVGRPGPSTVAWIHQIKRDLLTLRRATWPLRDALNSLLREPDGVFDDETRIYLRDCYDHMVQLMDLTETYRELAGGLMDLYLMSVSNRMNEIMKVLTIIATIFIPLSFVASVYGMNFDSERSPFNMPELKWEYGYLFSLGLMATIATSLLVYFQRKGWLGTRS